MRSQRLGTSDIELTTVGLGAWAIGGLMWGGCDATDAVAAVRASLDARAAALTLTPSERSELADVFSALTWSRPPRAD